MCIGFLGLTGQGLGLSVFLSVFFGYMQILEHIGFRFGVNKHHSTTGATGCAPTAKRSQHWRNGVLGHISCPSGLTASGLCGG